MQNLSSLATFWRRKFLTEAKEIIIVIFFLLSSFAQTVNSQNVFINEIAWMGSQTSSSDEWIELYNSANLPISLDDWSLKAVDGRPEINLSEEISANGFYLLERTDDDSVPWIAADQIYSGPLENNGEKLELYDSAGNLIDSVDCSSGWLAGDNVAKKTMERVDPKNWQSSQNAGGTPKTKNSIINMIEIGHQSSPTLPQEKLKLLDYPFGIVFNEILPSPEGPDSEEEWIVATIQQMRINSAYL